MRILFLFILLTNISASCQAPPILWQSRFGGSNLNLCLSSQQTQDGGFIFGGRSNSNISGDKTENSRGGNDYWIIKTNSSGQFEWDKTIGGNNPNGYEDDDLYFIKQTNDSGYIICGSSNSPLSGEKSDPSKGYLDFWIIKTNSAGIIEWNKTIGGNYDDIPFFIISTSDNGYIIGGYSESNISSDKTEICRGLQDFWVVKINNLGNIEWDKTYGGNGNDILRTVIETFDGGYLLCGRSNSNISGDKTENSKGSSDYWIIKTDTIGNILWQKTIGGSGFEELTKVIQLPNSNFFLSGYSNSPISGDKNEPCRGGYDFWGVKIDLNGTVLWQKTIGGNYDDYLSAKLLQNNNELILYGTSSSSISGEKSEPAIGGSDAWVIKTDLLGNIQWQKVIGGTNDDQVSNFIQTEEGGYLLSGITNSPISGDISLAPKGIYDYWVVKLAPDNLSINNNNTLNFITVYPNPTSDFIIINFSESQEKIVMTIKNILGQELSSKSYYQIKNITSNIIGENGIYFLAIVNNDGYEKTIKVIKQ